MSNTRRERLVVEGTYAGMSGVLAFLLQQVVKASLCLGRMMQRAEDANVDAKPAFRAGIRRG
ncbi:MAG: hypothetical protein QNJ20_14155 [Paracoccaceae bacterium]|nr:hypothetical protein [Paracoccaceae bacterium]